MSDDKSPNKKIDKAVADLLKEITDEKDIMPDVLKAKVSVVTLAVNWEKVKHNIRDEDEFNAANI